MGVPSLVDQLLQDIGGQVNGCHPEPPRYQGSRSSWPVALEGSIMPYHAYVSFLRPLQTLMSRRPTHRRLFPRAEAHTMQHSVSPSSRLSRLGAV